jgi:Tfp pilus assembly protein PilO
VSLFGRILVEKRAAVLPIAVAIAGNLAAYGLVVYPMQRRAASGEARVLASQRTERAAARDLAAARAMQTGKQVAEAQLQKFYHQVLPATSADARKAAYLRLAQLAAQSNLQYQRQTAAETPEKDSPLTKLNLTLVLSGSYQDVRRFIRAIELAPEFLIIDNVVLSSRDEPNSALLLTLSVSTYFWTGGNA